MLHSSTLVYARNLDSGVSVGVRSGSEAPTTRLLSCTLPPNSAQDIEWTRCKSVDSSHPICFQAARHDGEFIAVQCKFLASSRTISKEEPESLTSASAKPQFSERMIVETTKKPLSPHPETMLQGQAITTIRIGL